MVFHGVRWALGSGSGAAHGATTPPVQAVQQFPSRTAWHCAQRILFLCPRRPALTAHREIEHLRRGCQSLFRVVSNYALEADQGWLEQGLGGSRIVRCQGPRLAHRETDDSSELAGSVSKSSAVQTQRLFEVKRDVMFRWSPWTRKSGTTFSRKLVVMSLLQSCTVQ